MENDLFLASIRWYYF